MSLRSEAPWVRDLTNEMRSFPLGTHDDQVDAMSGAMSALTQQDRIQSVLPRSVVQLCVDAYLKHERDISRIIATERPFVGFRIAESGADRTSMVTRRGPVIVAAEQWDVSALDSLERVDRHCREVGALGLYHDRRRVRGRYPYQSSGKCGENGSYHSTRCSASTSALLPRGATWSLCGGRPTRSISPDAARSWAGRCG